MLSDIMNIINISERRSIVINHNLLDYVSNAASYIEKNIKSELCLDTISADLFISKFYLNRIFSAITGQKLMSYVNGRKLMHSLDALLHTENRILDIALEYGFHYEKSYVRAFKREFGMTPGAYRKTKCELKTTPVVNTNNLIAISEKAIIMEPCMIVKPAFFLIGNRCYVDSTAYESTNYVAEFANDFYFNGRQTIDGRVIDESYYGHVRYGENAHNYYTASVEVQSDAQPPEGMVKLEVPASGYWVFRYVGLFAPEKMTFMDFAHIFGHVYKWFETAGQEPTFPYHFEKISERFKNRPYCELDLYFPISEKRNPEIEQ